VATLGFQAWQYFNTIGGECPSCEAPARVIKTNSDGEGTPTICFNCGAVLQANYDNTAIDNITGKNSVMDDDFGGSQQPSIYDLFGGAPAGYTTSTSTTSTNTAIYEDGKPRSQKKVRNDLNIIDAEIEDDGDDKPFQ
jgi:hypothetical protein